MQEKHLIKFNHSWYNLQKHRNRGEFVQLDKEHLQKSTGNIILMVKD